MGQMATSQVPMLQEQRYKRNPAAKCPNQVNVQNKKAKLPGNFILYPSLPNIMNSLYSRLGVSASGVVSDIHVRLYAYSFYSLLFITPMRYHTHLLFFLFFSQCTVTCGQGLRYRVVLCIDHRGMHTGGCTPKTKPHIKEECIIPTPCYKPKGNEGNRFS